MGSTTSTTESLGGMCTAYSQCVGQNWSGCTVCPGRQVCKLNGKDPWTKVCVDPLAELSGDPSSTDAAIIVRSGGQVFLFLSLSLSLSLSPSLHYPDLQAALTASKPSFKCEPFSLPTQDLAELCSCLDAPRTAVKECA